MNRKMKKGICMMLMAVIMMTAAVPLAGAKPSALSLLKVCKVTVDKQVLFLREDDSSRQATITLACDQSKVKYSDIAIVSFDGNQVTAKADSDGRVITVTAQNGGAGYILLSHQNYVKLKIRFRVFGTFDQERPEQRVKPEMSNKDKVFIAEYRPFFNQLKDADQYKKKSFDTFNNMDLVVSRDNMKQVSAVIKNTILPAQTQYLYKIKQVKPKSPELLLARNYYLQSAQNRYDGLKLMVQAFAGKELNMKLSNQASEKVLLGNQYENKAVEAIYKVGAKFALMIEEY
ncbi:hypothetical protein [Paenibacillus sp. GCM10027626]|uniref:hypothetical protein n=1 Tax=Paenibacillus sp. GCM10027626 TaxID=3273411 RepID=UPI0036434D3D